MAHFTFTYFLGFTLCVADLELESALKSMDGCAGTVEEFAMVWQEGETLMRPFYSIIIKLEQNHKPS